jgi:hypothetical protein
MHPNQLKGGSQSLMATTNETASGATSNGVPTSPEASVASATTKRRQPSASRRRTTAQRAARSASKRRTTTSQTKQPDTFASQVTGVAESAVLIPVGVALETRDRVIEAIRPWTSRTGAERELSRVRRNVRKFERRGSVARNRAVRQIRSRRTRATRELRKRRTQVTRLLRVRRTQANRAIKQNGKRARTELRRQRREVQKVQKDVQKAVGPQVTRVQHSLQEQTKQARDRVQQLV